jgi:thiopurine S-methyltransferase
MTPDFWHDRWAKKQIGFHESAANDLLVAHCATFGWAAGARVFVPLCGTTRDIGWLLAHGFQVAGAELSRVAIEELFAELGVVPDIEQIGAQIGTLTRFSAEGIVVFAGDIFDLTAEALGPVDAVYDRAALIALPPEMRVRYAAHLVAVTGGVSQVVITLEYDQSQMSGPPFSVPQAELHNHYADRFQITELDSRKAGGPVARFGAKETLWRVQALDGLKHT